ncbi:MAG: cobalamin biosynthesis protein CobW, partial [Acetatifactor sp.]|nr:cobalamin biosynthesis protein CobW [Acetatifactor sp.]
DVALNSAVAVVDASKCKMYIKNFGEFFVNQIEHAGTIILSRTGNMSQEKLQAAVELIRQHNAKATIITTPWEELEGKAILETIEGVDNLEDMMKEMLEHAREHEHHHHYDENGVCSCGHHHHDHEEHEHHHDHEEHEHHHDHDEHEHHHHDHDEHEHHHDHEEHEHHHDHEEHEHHHDHDEHEHHHDHEGHEHHHHDHEEHEHHHHYDENGVCSCGHHHDEDEEHNHDHHHDHDHHHGHHHADEVFSSWGMETPNAYTAEDIEKILSALDSGDYGMILRSKGMVPAGDGSWIYFDYVPEEHDVRDGKPEVTGKICVIGSKLNEEKLAELFRK